MTDKTMRNGNKKGQSFRIIGTYQALAVKKTKTKN